MNACTIAWLLQKTQVPDCLNVHECMCDETRVASIGIVQAIVAWVGCMLGYIHPKPSKTMRGGAETWLLITPIPPACSTCNMEWISTKKHDIPSRFDQVMAQTNVE